MILSKLSYKSNHNSGEMTKKTDIHRLNKSKKRVFKDFSLDVIQIN